MTSWEKMMYKLGISNIPLVMAPLCSRDCTHYVSPTAASLKSTLSCAYRHFCLEEDREREKNFIPNVTQLYADSSYRRKEASGDETLKKIEGTIKQLFPKGRFKFQIQLHNQMLRATLKQTLGNNYEHEFERVCKERNWDGPKKNMFVIASRRSGKTTGMSSMIAALLMHVPNVEIVVYSVGERSAKEFVKLIEKYVQLIPGGTSRIKSSKAEELVVYGDRPGDERRVRSFPSGGNAKNVSHIFPFLCVCTQGVSYMSKNSQKVHKFLFLLTFFKPTKMTEEPTPTEKYLELLDPSDIGTDDNIDDDDENLTKKAAKDIDFINTRIMQLFEESNEKKPLQTLQEVLPKIAASIQEYEDNEGEIIIDNYFADKAFPLIIVHIMANIQEHLPNSCQLRMDHWKEFAGELIGRLSPNYRFDMMRVTSMTDMLSPNSEDVCGPVLNEDETEWLIQKAKQMLSHDKKLVENGEEDNADEMKRLPREHKTHLKQIVCGNMPYGFNTKNIHSWKTVDMTKLLDPDYVEDKSVTTECYNHLLTTAESIKTKLQERSQTRGLTEHEQRQLNHVQKMLEKKALPNGYHLSS